MLDYWINSLKRSKEDWVFYLPWWHMDTEFSAIFFQFTTIQFLQRLPGLVGNVIPTVFFGHIAVGISVPRKVTTVSILDVMIYPGPTLVEFDAPTVHLTHGGIVKISASTFPLVLVTITLILTPVIRSHFFISLFDLYSPIVTSIS